MSRNDGPLSSPSGRLYDYPLYYDVAFGPGTQEQVDHLHRLIHEHLPTARSSDEPLIVLEPAAGTGRVMMALAERGYRVSGYDSHPLMVAFSAGRIAQAEWGERVDIRLDKMQSARYPRDYHVAVNVFNSLGHLYPDNEIVSHFQQVAACLRPAGIYIVQTEMAWQDVQSAEVAVWNAERDGVWARVQWEIVHEDRNSRVSIQRCKMTVKDRWRTVDVDQTMQLRLWMPAELEQLARLGGFEVEAVYTEYLEPLVFEVSLSGELGNLYLVLRTTAQ